MEVPKPSDLSMRNVPLCVAEERSVHGHRATVLIVAGHSAPVHGQHATFVIVAGRSATVGNVAKKDGVVTLPACMLLPLSHSLFLCQQ